MDGAVQWIIQMAQLIWAEGEFRFWFWTTIVLWVSKILHDPIFGKREKKYVPVMPQAQVLTNPAPAPHATKPSLAPGMVNNEEKVQPHCLPPVLYHGTTIIIAKEIYKSNLWMVGGSAPAGVWLTSDRDIARDFTFEKGAIVVVKPLSHENFITWPMNPKVFVYTIPISNPYNEYFEIPSLMILGVIDCSYEYIEGGEYV